ncbi:hypothetical protein PUNSTDRAFT_138360 [Punctularia strigosozonata HHB-11173 SS5]|uniref:Uncharacterized protein n=1 Tax=Punctularia strigosozonata (strain HHB-11173) TaxID=741275 RepID=R7S4D6_PUNST|nr:uncharacterized protein PUNSTDRAFT_138360 [Punctularia strigosozonata HHB-11173 SS5]EIN04714.1 hypothetical protein PUNSTDRAFT_138360 [Punctularia strigosozonata HHB-11173 SS5]
MSNTIMNHPPEEAQSESILPEPDFAKYPWCRYLLTPYTNKETRPPEEVSLLAESFEPLSELPAIFDPLLEEGRRYSPPTFFFGWPVDDAKTLEIALELDLVWYWDEDGMGSTWKSQADVRDGDVVDDDCTLTEVQYRSQKRGHASDAWRMFETARSDSQQR